MWGFQPHFRISQECVAKRVFGLLDERFEPQVFLVGILVDENENKYPACVEPEQDFWAESEAFDPVLERARQICESYPERQLMHSHPRAQKWHDEGLRSRSIRDAILQLIAQNARRPRELSFLVSPPTKVNSYSVHVVLGLETAIIQRHPRLTKESVPIHEFRSKKVCVSLIDAVGGAYLDKAAGELQQPDPGADLSELKAEEIVREGANRLMTDLAYRAAPGCTGGWSDFLSSCAKVSGTPYEGSEGRGLMVLARKDHSSLEKVVTFTTPTRLRVTRAARKLIQLASEEMALHTDSEDLYGLVRVRGYTASNEDLFTIRFDGMHRWSVLHDGETLMSVKYGQPYLSKPPFDEEKLREDLPRIFGRMTERHIARILSLIREAERERHGTTLIISKGARRESERLAAQSTPIVRRAMSPELLSRLTPVDGAILLNPKGTCYAIGVILDGMATAAGNPARGARYNSAIRYVSSTRYPCLAVIVSEDGGIDFFPDLKPMILRSSIEAALATLRQSGSKHPISYRRYGEAMDWLDRHRFYLLPDDCEEINNLVELIEMRLLAEYPLGVRAKRSKFVPHEEMNSSLYYKPE
jgi:hypothetical protein